MKEVRIPGSKYDLCLEEDQNQYFLRLRIGGKVEDELPLTHMESKAIKMNIKTLLEQVHLTLNDIQLDRLHKKIWEAIEKILNNSQTKRRYGTIKDERVDSIIERIETLEYEIEKLENKISENEAKLT